MTEEQIAQEALRRMQQSAGFSSSNKNIDIEDEALRRIKNEMPASLPESKPSREHWQKINPTGDYDEAMKMRDASPMVAVDENSSDASYKELMDRLKAADEKASESSSNNNGITDYAKNAYSIVADNPKTIAEMGAGYALGKSLRNYIPQKNVIGTEEYKALENERKMHSEGTHPTQRSAIESELAAKYAEQEHQNRLNILDQQRQAAEQQHAANQEALRKAQEQHIFAEKLNTDNELARRANPNGLSLPAPSNVVPNLTPHPIGGEGTYNYSTKFGATPQEALRVPSMSAMQQENIPKQAQSFQTIQRLEPDFQATKESPLLLGQEGRKATAERIYNESKTQEKHQSQADLERQRMEDSIKKHKALVKFQLEQAQKAAEASAKAVADSAKAHRTHEASSAMTPQQRASMESNQMAADELQKRVIANTPNALAKFGAKAFGRFVPGVGAAFAPIEAEEAYKNYLAGNYGRAAAHGLGTLGAFAQATGVPLLMGAGDIMQIPAAGLSIYDLLNEKEKQ